MWTSGSQQIDDVLDGCVGAVVGGFEPAGWLMEGDGAVVESAMCERAAEPLVEEEEEQGNLDALLCETVGVSGSITLQQTMTFELAQVIAQLIEAVASVGEVKAGEDGLVDLFGSPAAEVSAAVQEDLEEADDTRVLDPDTGIANRADGDGKGDALQQREVDMDVEPLRLEAGEAAGDVLESLAHGIEMIQTLPELEIGEVVGDQLVAQEGGELLVLFEEGVPEVGTEDMMTMLDAVDDGGELAAHPAVEACAEDFGDLVGGQPPQTEFAATLE
jgi:hypothetical protein